MVDALLVMDVESDDPRIDTLSRLGHPSVLIGLPAGRRDDPVRRLRLRGGRLARRRPAQSRSGHRRLALIGSPPEVMKRHTSYAERLARGFLAACEASGVTGTVHPCPSSTEVGRDRRRGRRRTTPSITGFFVHNEGALPHVAARLAEHRHAGATTTSSVVALCPEDVARLVPGLADSIAVPAEAIGAAATDMICEILANGRPARRAPPARPRSRAASSPRACSASHAMRIDPESRGLNGLSDVPRPSSR